MGQKVNFEKSSIMFSPNLSDAVKDELCSFLRIPQTNQTEKQLGLPTIIGRNKSTIFAYVKDEIW